MFGSSFVPKYIRRSVSSLIPNGNSANKPHPMVSYVNGKIPETPIAQAPPPPAYTPKIEQAPNPTPGMVYNPPKPQTMVQAPGPTPGMVYQPPAKQEIKLAPAPVPGSVSNVPTTEPDYTLKDNGPLTEQGKLYNSSVLSRQQGIDPVSKNAQMTENTQASRREYMGNMNARESAAQARYKPGTIQYQRMMDQNQAGINAANLSGQNQVNEFTRARSAEADQMGLGVENNAMTNALGERNFLTNRSDIGYQRGIDATDRALKRSDLEYERGITAEDKVYTRAQTERTYQDTKSLLSKGDVTGAINSIPTQKGKNYLLQIKASGGDVPAAIASMFNPDNSLKTEFRDSSPVADIRAQAEEWVDMVAPGLDPAARSAAVVKRMQELDAAKQGPITNATTAQAQETIRGKITTGEPLTPDEVTSAVKAGTIPSFTPANLGGYQDKQVADLIGKPISINGKVYTVVKGDRTRTGAGTFSNQERHTNWTEIKDGNGTSFYVYNGKINTAPPKSVSNDATPFGF